MQQAAAEAAFIFHYAVYIQFMLRLYNSLCKRQRIFTEPGSKKGKEMGNE